MATITKPDIRMLFADKARLRELVAEQSAALALEYEPSVTAEEAQKSILEDGIRPEDNLFSCGIIRAREE